MTVLWFLFAWLSPWVLGTAISLACLKRRYGFRSFALGSGYLIGLFLMVMTIKLHNYYQQPINSYTILIGYWVLALPLLFFVRARPCSIEELRLEKAPSNVAYFLTLLLVLVMLVRLLLMLWNLPQQAESAIDTLQTYHDIFTFGNKWFIHFADLQQLQQYYTQVVLAATPIDAVWLHLPWLGTVVAMVCLVFGGLRYLGIKLLPAMASAYLLLSLPFLNDYLSTTQPLLLWLSANYLLVIFLAVMFISFQEWRLLVLLSVAVAAVSVSQYLLLLSVISLIVLFLGYKLGKGGTLPTVIILILLIGGGYWLMPDVATQIQTSIPLSGQAVQTLADTLYQAIFLRDDWHLLLLATIVSIFILLLSKARHDTPSLQLVVIAVWVAVLGWLALLLRGQTIDNELFPVYFRETLLYFAPILCLLPACVAHLINRNDDSLPTI